MKPKKRLALGLDSSTQSLSAVILDMDSQKIVLEYSLSYRSDARLNGFGFDYATMIVPPREPGEADQPPLLFLASLDAMFADLAVKLPEAGLAMADITAINTSGQQHGHVYLSAAADAAFAKLKSSNPSISTNLAESLAGIFAYGTAPIWKTANTGPDSDAIRRGVGGSKKMVTLSGSDSPLRFSGAVIRRVGRQFPQCYAATNRILLISNFIPAVLCGDPSVGIDFGNGAGMSLMNYKGKTWDKSLLKAAASGLPDGTKGLSDKLGPVVHPLTQVGKAASYFVNRYGLSVDCAIIAGSGDNPQTKVLFDGDLLSLGTSFVMMASTDGSTDPQGWANAMYDGLGRPFCFGCRTNGALVWERVRTLYGLASNDFGACDQALQQVPASSVLRWWQPDQESFPLSPAGEFTRIDSNPIDFNHDYAAVVDSALGLLYQYSRGFAGQEKGSLFLSGGPSTNPYIVKRIAAIWNCPVVVIGKAGAALGAALAAAAATLKPADRERVLPTLSEALIAGAKAVWPDPGLVSAYHGNADKPGYLKNLEKAFTSRLASSK